MSSVHNNTQIQLDIILISTSLLNNFVTVKTRWKIPKYNQKVRVSSYLFRDTHVHDHKRAFKTGFRIKTTTKKHKTLTLNKDEPRNGDQQLFIFFHVNSRAYIVTTPDPGEPRLRNEWIQGLRRWAGLLWNTAPSQIEESFPPSASIRETTFLISQVRGKLGVILRLTNPFQKAFSFKLFVLWRCASEVGRLFYIYCEGVCYWNNSQNHVDVKAQCLSSSVVWILELCKLLLKRNYIIYSLF